MNTVNGPRVRVIGLGDWGARAAEFFASQGVPAHTAETDGRGLVSGEDLGRTLAESGDDLLVVVGHVGSGAGTHMGAVLELASEAAPDAGRLAIARLPGVQSAPDDRARGLIALNTLLEAPEASILLVQPTRGLGISAESEANEVLERIVRLFVLPGHEEAVARLSSSALGAHLATPGFVGWREIELSSEMCAQDAPGWMESLPGRGAVWQPEGFAWSDAQSVLPIARLPREWIDAGGREQFDRFVQEAWSEAAPCAIARSLQAGDPPQGMILSTGLSYPEGLLELRDSVQADRERLDEKRRAAATPIPLGDDFLPRRTTQRSEAPRERASAASKEPRGDRRVAEKENVQDSEAAASGPTRQAGAEPTHLEERVRHSESTRDSGDRASDGVDRADDRPRHGEHRAGVAALSHESTPDRLELEPVEEGHGFAETRTVVVTAEEIETDEIVEAEIAPVEEDATVVPTGEVEAEEAEEEPRIDEAPRVSPYEAALSLAWRVLNSDDLETRVDLGEIRYALYDLLEVVREDPGSILREVFRRNEKDYFERHHVNVAILSILTADQLGATLSDIIDLATAAVLHDIGMADSREDWDADVRLAPKVFDTTIRQHPQRGHERLKKIPGMTADITRIVREEHERLDGTGYPEGLSGDAIDPGARIVAVADTLEALTHARPYRERLTLGEALSRLQILGQYTLDMAVVQTLTDALTEFMPSLDTESDEA
ncbi:MAG: HD-GYP domain-containing protein [Gemmatimonadota bacterium]